MSPQRAQRVRGVPGVGLRTPDGREWLRRGGRREGAEQREYAAIPGWHIVRCAHDSVYPACDDCVNDEMATFTTVKSCTRPGEYGNPYGVRAPDQKAVNPRAWCIWAGGERLGFHYRSREDATSAAVFLFGKVLTEQDDAYFAELAKFDYLSCFCPLDQPCHVDAIIEEGKRRGVWK